MSENDVPKFSFDEVRTAAELIELQLVRNASSIIVLGKELLVAEDLLSDSDFNKWLEKDCNLSLIQASCFMGLAKAYPNGIPTPIPALLLPQLAEASELLVDAFRNWVAEPARQ